jgi:methyl-accepting chemotaxis protein
MNLKKRLILSFLFVGFIPFAIGVGYSVMTAGNALTQAVHDKLAATEAIKYKELNQLYDRWYGTASILSKSRKLQDIFTTVDESGWSSASKYQSYFENLLKESRFEDMLMVSNEGKILGAVKQTSLAGTSMEQLKDSPLYNSWKKSMSTEYKGLDSVQYSKFKSYPAFDNKQESFLVTSFAPNSKDRGRWLKGESIGSLVFLMSPKYIDEVVNERSGMGKTGEMYLVEKGSDGKTYYASNRVVKKGPVGKSKGGSTIKKLFKEKKAFNVTKTGSTGVEEVAYARYFKYRNTELGMFTTQSKDEALASVTELKTVMMVLGAIFAAVIIVFSNFVSARISGPILSISKELFASADKVSDTAKSVSDSSSRLSSATTQQAAGLQETVSSVDEISAMIDRNTDASTESKSVSEQSRQVAVQGKDKITQMINAINRISESNSQITGQMSESNERIGEIVKLIREIGEKTNVINDIVFQTKLLSFNASVEAARAGEHGKGFAVVAEEVGNLANMSGKAAEEISTMLESSVKTVEDIINSTSQKVEGLISTGKQTVDEGSKLAGQCGEALDKIVTNVSKVNSQISEIATASVEQSQGVSEVNEAMKQIDEVTHMNTQISNESSSQAAALEHESKSLYNEVLKLQSLVNGSKVETDSSESNVTSISSVEFEEEDRAA